MRVLMCVSVFVWGEIVAEVNQIKLYVVNISTVRLIVPAQMKENIHTTQHNNSAEHKMYLKVHTKQNTQTHTNANNKLQIILTNE